LKVWVRGCGPSVRGVDPASVGRSPPDSNTSKYFVRTNGRVRAQRWIASRWRRDGGRRHCFLVLDFAPRPIESQHMPVRRDDASPTHSTASYSLARSLSQKMGGSRAGRHGSSWDHVALADCFFDGIYGAIRGSAIESCERIVSAGARGGWDSCRPWRTPASRTRARVRSPQPRRIANRVTKASPRPVAQKRFGLQGIRKISRVRAGSLVRTSHRRRSPRGPRDRSGSNRHVTGGQRIRIRSLQIVGPIRDRIRVRLVTKRAFVFEAKLALGRTGRAQHAGTKLPRPTPMARERGLSICRIRLVRLGWAIAR